MNNISVHWFVSCYSVCTVLEVAHLWPELYVLSEKAIC